MGAFDYHNHHAASHMGKVHIRADDGTTDEHTIRYDGTAFDPTDLDITLGDTVTWINEGDADMMIMGGVGGGHDHDDHDHGDEETQKSPGAPAVLLLWALACLVWHRRR